MEMIFQFFRYPKPESKTLEYWFQEIKYIPSGKSLEYIMTDLKQRETMPRNLPAAFKKIYHEYRSGGSAENSSFPVTACAVCKGKGFLIVEIFDVELRRNYEYTFRCGECENWRRELGESIPMTTVQEVQQKGWEILPYRRTSL
jgi:hypothetical protein